MNVNLVEDLKEGNEGKERMIREKKISCVLLDEKLVLRPPAKISLQGYLKT